MRSGVLDLTVLTLGLFVRASVGVPLGSVSTKHTGARGPDAEVLTKGAQASSLLQTATNRGALQFFRDLCCHTRAPPPPDLSIPHTSPEVHRVTIVPGRYTKLSKNLEEYVQPEHDPTHLYGHPDKQDRLGGVYHPNAGEQQGIHYVGLTQGSSRGGRAKAYWAHPGHVWRIDRDFSVTKVSGPGSPRTFQSSPEWQHFDAVHRGQVVGKFELGNSRDGTPIKVKKGVYSIEDSPVHMFGPDARPTAADARETLDSMVHDHDFA